MKKICGILLLFFIGINSYGQATTDNKQIQATVVRFFDGLANFNDAAMAAELSKDFTLVEHGLIWNQDSLLTHIKPMRAMNIKRVNQFDFTKTERKGDVAWVIYYNTANMTMGDKKRTVKWLESALLVKEAGAWKIKLMHSTDL